MQLHWIETPRGTWCCVTKQYQGIIVDLGGAWLARVEGSRTVYPATTTFHSLREAQVWIERKLTALVEEHEEPV